MIGEAILWLLGRWGTWRRERGEAFADVCEGRMLGGMSARLIDLKPRWWAEKGRRWQGVSFLCPHCREVRLGVAFAKPLDGGAPFPVATQSLIRALIHDLRTFDVPPGICWANTGNTFETLTLTPSVDASKSGHWHGHVTLGECSP